MRKEPINVRLIYDFLSRTDDRRAAHSKRGSLLNELRVLILRVIPGSIQDGIGYIRVCYQCEKTSTLMHTRMYTGLNKLPTVVAILVDGWFGHELKAGVPRTKMGRGTFSYGSLVKVIARQGLIVVDGDPVQLIDQIMNDKM